MKKRTIFFALGGAALIGVVYFLFFTPKGLELIYGKVNANDASADSESQAGSTIDYTPVQLNTEGKGKGDVLGQEFENELTL